MVSSRNPIQVVKILNDGRLAEKVYQLAECLRHHNVTHNEYRRMAKDSQWVKPLEFPTKQSAMDYINENYGACLNALTPPTIEPEETMPRAKAKAGKATWLDEATVECIATDLLENREMSLKQIAKRWHVSEPTIYKIRRGHHAKSSEKMVLMLKAAFTDTPLEALNASIPRAPIPIAQWQRTELDTMVATQEPTMTAEQDKLGTKSVGACQNDRQQATLKEMLQAVRKLMDAQGIVHITLPLHGDIRVRREEILV